MSAQDFTAKLNSHDWWYSRSDDRRAHERGLASYKALCEAFHKLPIDEASTLWLSIAPDNFKPPT